MSDHDKSVHHPVDLLQSCLLEQRKVSQKDKKAESVCKFQFIQLQDNKIVIEDEKKFQDYFLKDIRKIRSPINPFSELFLNKELIEQNQEMIIENEEQVPNFSVPSEKYSNGEKTRRTTLPNKKNILPTSWINSLKSGLSGWYQKETKELIGLKGGADHAILENKIMVRIDHTAQDSISSIYSFYFDSLK